MDHSMEYIQKCAADLSLKYETDLNSSDFISEIKDFKYQAFSLLPDLRAATPLALLQLITTYSLRAEYPNVETALRIFLTLPITVATCERSFSKLKLIKKHLRSIMGQERISDMAILSIEHTLSFAPGTIFSCYGTGLMREKYKELGPFICIDCSRQNDDTKTSSIDLRVEIKAANNFQANTAAYCLIIHDRIVQYNPFTGEVKKL
ncbi:Uncharacterized protein FWK35_00006458 [Aphis craccivora]|uniref:Uncharacterized protein n=1 Tax=Aphis craccivora TaxID=307492 RepID=A0A6G0YY67_APHCR|nr:Uncharacterized protein FWK35_00006458 [Aphis craccivora]